MTINPITKLLKVASVTSLVTTFTLSLHAQEKTEPTPDKASPSVTDKKTLQQKISYGLGFQNGEQFASYGFNADDLDKEAYIKGLIDALMKKDFGNDPAAYEQAMKDFDKIVTTREQALAKANEAAEKAFLETNGKRKEVVTTATGLQYEIIKKGDGKSYTPPAGNTEKTDQTTQFYLICNGKLLDGTEFTQTPKDKPTPFTLQIIPGLAEALKMMPIGSKWKIYIPAELGFGELRQGPKISPKSMLTYELELTDIKAGEPAPNIPQLLIPK